MAKSPRDAPSAPRYSRNDHSWWGSHESKISEADRHYLLSPTGSAAILLCSMLILGGAFVLFHPGTSVAPDFMNVSSHEESMAMGRGERASA